MSSGSPTGLMDPRFRGNERRMGRAPPEPTTILPDHANQCATTRRSSERRKSALAVFRSCSRREQVSFLAEGHAHHGPAPSVVQTGLGGRKSRLRGGCGNAAGDRRPLRHVRIRAARPRPPGGLGPDAQAAKGQGPHGAGRDGRRPAGFGVWSPGFPPSREGAAFGGGGGGPRTGPRRTAPTSARLRAARSGRPPGAGERKRTRREGQTIRSEA